MFWKKKTCLSWINANDFRIFLQIILEYYGVNNIISKPVLFLIIMKVILVTGQHENTVFLKR